MQGGNKITPEFEAYMSGHCWKCGHSSHTFDKCRIYPEKQTVITLCCVCCQGLHEVCRSRRPDLKGKTEARPTITEQVKALTMSVQNLCAIQYAAPPPLTYQGGGGGPPNTPHGGGGTPKSAMKVTPAVFGRVTHPETSDDSSN